MKNYLVFILMAVTLLVCLGCSGPRETSLNDTSPNNFNVLGNENINYQLEASLPTVPTHLPVYTIIRPEVNDKYVSDIGAKFGLSGLPQNHVNDEGGFYTMENEETGEILQVFTETGAITFGFKSGAKLFPSDAPSLPDDETAKEIAVDYLNERGLLSPDVQAGEVVAGGTYKEDIAAHLLVRFDYSIGGLPVTGTGKKFGVRIGDGGESIQVMMYHVESQTVGTTVPIKTAEQAYQDLLDNKGKIERLNVQGRNVRITNVSLGYWLDSIGTIQEFVYPVYIFDVEYYDENGIFEYDFTEWVDARRDL